ncbi:MAG: hypothetical protein IJ568_06180 [Bacilli bacterium]|nr:hypothetical protein [Bacilli bacterium]
MAYNLKITENDKTKEQTIKDLKEFKEILEQFKEKKIEVELHKIKVLKKGE